RGWRTMTSRVWIVPVNYNGLADTRKCLQSLAELSVPASVVVVDNASADDPTPTLKQEFPGVHVVRNPVNGGWSGGNNAGIRFALDRGVDFVILLNNDTTVHPALVARLLAAAAANPRFGIIGPVIRYMDEPDTVMTDGTLFNRPGYPGFFQRQPVPERAADPPAVEETDIVNGCCMLVRAEIFSQIGFIDDRFFLIHEEADFCLRAREAGWQCGILAEGLIWHKGSSAFKRSGQRWQRYYDTRNLGLLLSKHRSRLPARRSGWRSRLLYWRYAYHRYCHEREDGQADAATAVLEGLADAIARRFGAYQVRSRWLKPILRLLFEAARRLKPPRHKQPIDVRKDLWRGPA
ncbi:MAG TPA: glycosyltransferase family 2 protein, partial [Urbifossiella sp.]|nr:glycosyltransferase family 2 protein [Urbifossiella sp.]